jgi:hypothetical protein
MLREVTVTRQVAAGGIDDEAEYCSCGQNRHHHLPLLGNVGERQTVRSVQQAATTREASESVVTFVAWTSRTMPRLVATIWISAGGVVIENKCVLLGRTSVCIGWLLPCSVRRGQMLEPSARAVRRGPPGRFAFPTIAAISCGALFPQL